MKCVVELSTEEVVHYLLANQNLGEMFLDSDSEVVVKPVMYGEAFMGVRLLQDTCLKAS